MNTIYPTYQQLKAQYPDHIILLRVGDFLEAYEADAEAVSDVCGIALTSRQVRGVGRVWMTAFPHHAAEPMVKALIDAGYKVALGEWLPGYEPGMQA